jgi:hypothetical protein
MAMTFAFRTALLVGVMATAAAGCATTRAETPLERPALDVPMPPPRMIVPLPPPETPLPDPVQPLPDASVPAPARPRPTRDKETAKPEAKPEETKPVDPAPAAVPAPVPPLRIPEGGDPAQLSGQIAGIINRTLETLKGIDYRTLQKPRQKAYDDAKQFATQAEEALKANNLVYAKELADKAERLAKELQGR